MKQNNDDTRRIVLCIRAIFTAGPNGITAEAIRLSLPKALRPSLRTVQRDLVAAQRWVRICSDTSKKPFVWRRERGKACPVCCR